MIDKKDASKFVEELARLDEQFTDDLIEEFVDDIRREEASGKINGGGEENE